MFFVKEKIEYKVVLHQGIFKKTATLSEAVFMITGMTIGAGILGIPFVVAQVGVALGVAYIVFLGIIMLALNLMIAEVAMAAKEHLQLPGLAGKFVGTIAKDIVSVTMICRSFGSLLAYVVGEGLALSTIFGGDPSMWSMIFWTTGSFLILVGLDRIKVVEKYLSSTVIALIVGLSLYFLFHGSVENISYTNVKNFLLPLGVIMFALSNSPAVAEVYALTNGDTKKFRRALIVGTLIPVLVYILFAISVVGVTGLSTTPIATSGLVSRFGIAIMILANVFPVLAMSTGFMGIGTALRETLSWDHHLSKASAAFLVIAVPFILFLSGFTNFITILEVVGGLFVSIEAATMVVVYWRARHAHKVPMPLTMLAIASPLILLAFFVGVSAYNFYHLFSLVK